jgi:hypothetical protein
LPLQRDNFPSLRCCLVGAVCVEANEAAYRGVGCGNGRPFRHRDETGLTGVPYFPGGRGWSSRLAVADIGPAPSCPAGRGRLTTARKTPPDGDQGAGPLRSQHSGERECLEPNTYQCGRGRQYVDLRSPAAFRAGCAAGNCSRPNDRRGIRPNRPADRGSLAVSKALTIRIAPWPEPIQGWSRAMISEFKELVVLPIAMILFLCAASTLPSLTWRSDPPAPIAVASR